MSTSATETQSSTGLAQPFKPVGNGTKRAAAKRQPAHLGKIWSAVRSPARSTRPPRWSRVCASAAERNWSVYGQIKNEKRHVLSHATGDKLVYCEEALHLKDKLQKAGYEAKMVKWDSDSDSDESDDEKELMQ